MMPLLLALAAIMIWVRDTAWHAVPGDALPLLAGYPLLAYLGRPWRRIKPENSERMPATALLAGISLYGLGLFLESTFVSSLGWTILLYAYLAPHLMTEDRSRFIRLLPLAALSFPWMISEGQFIGWWFRLSGAMVTTGIFHVIGFAVERQGTLVTIEGFRVSVEAACSGLNVLQSLLLAGTALAIQSGHLRSLRQLPVVALALFALAWFANTLRIVMISALGLSVGVEAARSPLLHDGTGLLTVCVVFAIWRFRSMQQRDQKQGAVAA